MSTASKWKLWLWFNTAEKCRCLEEDERTPESWATYSERVVEAARKVLLKRCQVRSGSTPGSDWLVAGNKNGEKVEGRRPEGPSLPGSTSISCLDGISVSHSAHPGPGDLFLTLLPGRALQAQPDGGTPFKASLLLRVSTRLKPALRLFLGTQATLPASPANLHSHPAQSCSSLPSGFPTQIVCSARTVACLCPRLATSYSSCRFHLSLGVRSSRNLLSSQRPQLRCPFCALLTHSCSPKTAGIT